MKMLTNIIVVPTMLAAMALSPVTLAGSPEGFTEPYRVIEVASPESGIVETLNIREGDIVHKGQVIAVLESRLLQASLSVAAARMKANANIESAQARYEQLKTRRTRIEALASRGSARPDEVAKARADAAIAVAELKGAREAQQIAELEYERLAAQIERRTVKSPISGVVVRIGRERGELVSGSDSAIAHIAELGRLNVVSYVSETAARKLKRGDAMSVTLTGGQLVDGKIDFVSPTVDPRSGTLQVKVLLNNSKGSIRSGTRASLAMNDPGIERGLSATQMVTPRLSATSN